MWEPQLQDFARSFRVIRCDLPGFGETPEGEGPSRWDVLVADLLGSLGITRFHVVAASIGSQVALDLALAHPGLVDRLVLAPPPLLGQPSPAIVDFGDAEEAALEAGDLDAAVELNLQTWVDGPARSPDRVDPTVRARVAEMQLFAFQHQTGAGWPTWLEPPAADRLTELKSPTLVITGDLDQPDVHSSADLLVTGISDCRRLAIPGAAHVVNMERPEAFNAAVLDFLGQR